MLEHMPLGRYIYAIGGDPGAAALNGIPVARYTVLAFTLSGLLTGVAGVLPACKLRIGQASVGLEFLLPALVGAFPGSTTILPGRVNVWGTLVGVAILAAGISGIQQLGVSFPVEPLFNGLTLLVAIGIAGYAQRRRRPRHAARQAAPPERGGRHGGELMRTVLTGGACALALKFHALYAEHEALVAISTLEVLQGGLPSRAMALMLEGAQDQRSELMRIGTYACSSGPRRRSRHCGDAAGRDRPCHGESRASALSEDTRWPSASGTG